MAYSADKTLPVAWLDENLLLQTYYSATPAQHDHELESPTYTYNHPNHNVKSLELAFRYKLMNRPGLLK